MKHYVKICPWLPADGMAIFPFILVKKAHFKTHSRLIFHELIHFKQQLELLILPFYVLYLLFFLWNLITYGNARTAYLNIPFEKEAYTHENNPNYFTSRKPFAWLNSKMPNRI